MRDLVESIADYIATAACIASADYIAADIGFAVDYSTVVAAAAGIANHIAAAAAETAGSPAETAGSPAETAGSPAELHFQQQLHKNCKTWYFRQSYFRNLCKTS